MLNTDLRVAIISFYESWKGLKLRVGIDQTQIQTKEQKIIKLRRKVEKMKLLQNLVIFSSVSYAFLPINQATSSYIVKSGKT